MSATQKLTGTLALGPVKYEKVAAVYDYMRVGSTYLKSVKVIGTLATLLRNGEDCTLWVATIRTPTPWFAKANIYMVYAVEIDGVVHQAIDEVRREWTISKTFTFIILFGAGFPTMFLAGIGLLLWINALRLIFAKLPIEAMRAAILPVTAPLPVKFKSAKFENYPKGRGPRRPVEVADKACPECGARMFKRLDLLNGKKLLACIKPECKHIEKDS